MDNNNTPLAAAWPVAGTGEETPNRAPRRDWPLVVAACVTGAALTAGALVMTFKDGPVAPTATFKLPESHGTLTMSKDPQLKAAADSLAKADRRLKDASTAYYLDPADDLKRVVVTAIPRSSTRFGLEDMLSGTAEKMKLSAHKEVDSGSVGGRTICAEGKPQEGTTATVCAWNDRAGSGMGFFINRPLDESAEWLRGLREAGTTG
jgi:hypothetical protein